MERKNLELRNLKKIAREKLLSDRYGKYDYVEDLLGPEYITQTKPRKIREHISELLQIPMEDLNYNTFLGWLRSYKKRETKLKSESSQTRTQHIPEINVVDPSNFTPTDPRILDKKREEDYLKNLIKVPDIS